MDKWQGLQSFWGSFGIPAYDENSVPDDAVMPYITYHAEISSFEAIVNTYASVWYYSTSWKDISNKVDEIASALSPYALISLDDHQYIYMGQGVPFAQRMKDPESESIKRIYMNVAMEFFTKH